MSSPGPFGEGNPFEGIPLFGDLARLFTGGGPLNWDVARQVALWIATEGQAETNVDPLVRIRLEELARVAEMHVSQATGLESGGIVTVRPVGRAEWAATTLEAYKPLFERLAVALGASAPDPGADAPDPATNLLGNLTQVLTPVMLGMQAGVMAGHLARRAMGQYELPIPRPGSDVVLVVGDTVDRFAADWSLPVDDVRLWVCLDQITSHTVLRRPHVAGRLTELLLAYAGSFEPDPNALEDKMGEVDPTDAESLQAVLGDPETLLGAVQTPEQAGIREQLSAVVAAIEGYVDYTVDQVGRNLITSYGSLTEALRRRRVEWGDGDRVVERLFGLDLDQAHYDRGGAFVRGVIERAGESALSRLWESATTLPTPAEIVAPGLWLARTEFD